METIKRKPMKVNVVDLRNLRFRSYQEYFYFINDLSTKINDFKMVVAGLLRRDDSNPMGYRCLTFDEFKNKLADQHIPATF